MIEFSPAAIAIITSLLGVMGTVIAILFRELIRSKDETIATLNTRNDKLFILLTGQLDITDASISEVVSAHHTPVRRR